MSVSADTRIIIIFLYLFLFTAALLRSCVYCLNRHMLCVILDLRDILELRLCNLIICKF